jgi:hypothetical protein
MIPLDWWLTLWIVVGVPLSVGWLLLIGIFVRPPNRRSFAWWVLPAVAVLLLAPIVWKFALWLAVAIGPATEVLEQVVWVLPVVAALAATGLFVWRYTRPQPQPDPILDAPPVIAPTPAPQEPQPAFGWAMPDEYREGHL